MKKLITLLFIVTSAYNALACTTCNRSLQSGIYNSTFYPNLLVMLSAFIVLAVIVSLLTRLATKKHYVRQAANPAIQQLTSVPLMCAAMVTGIGIGGFIDGIILHQILQWHEMLTNKIPPDTVLNKSINMFWDGVFHFFTLITTIVGIYLLWKLLHKKNLNKSGYLLLGGMAMGWGLFNLVEGIIDHHMLALHNVREVSPDKTLWNYGFLGFGILLLLLGWWWKKVGERSAINMHNRT